MSDANDKPLDLGSVVEALERIERGYKAMTPTHIRDTAQQAIATLRSTVTPAPVAKVVVDLSDPKVIERFIWGRDGSMRHFQEGNWLKFIDVATLLAQLPGVEVKL